jgi:phage terminase large subunit GpA-like protein
MSSSQIGKTSILDAVIGYFIDQDPSPILYVTKSLQLAETHSKGRLAPLVRATPALLRRIGEPRSRDSENSLLFKGFPGGFIVLAGANSAASLQSRPIRVCLLDEVDQYDADLEDQGDPVSLAVQRTARFWNRLVVLAGTPTVKGASRLEQAFTESDQRKRFIPCPHCGTFQVLEWRNVVWDEGKPETAAIRCTGCQRKWRDAARLDADRRGEWRATQPFAGTAGFHVWEAYAAPRLADMVAEFLEKKKQRESLQTFVNLKLGELWEAEEGRGVEWGPLRERAEEYAPDELPDPRIGLITAGVDTQDDRLSVLVLGFARGEETWVLHWEEIFGDTMGDGVFRELDELIARRIGDLPIACAAIDSGGHRTQRVYSYVRTRSPRVIAVHGVSQPGRPVLGRPSTQDISWRGKTIPNGVQLWPIGTDTAKGEIYARLRIGEPGPRFVHFYDGLLADFYEQLTNERLVVRYSRGVPRMAWDLPSGKRNEVLDCFVYAYAAAIRSGLQRVNWDTIEHPPEKRTAPLPNTSASTRKPWIERRQNWLS